ncbi:unnamed protein product [Effrenium voratum]|uniref:Uncharacterized protein n=1 Tax=Effrenium voratum TaxID=2562239 RepID=A0AA36N7L8_9DINO|nr:unnamed protein product [Effrenium voratum]CAJ1457029.1 unnamed protein product [Effrenium voratum]
MVFGGPSARQAQPHQKLTSQFASQFQYQQGIISELVRGNNALNSDLHEKDQQVAGQQQRSDRYEKDQQVAGQQQSIAALNSDRYEKDLQVARQQQSIAAWWGLVVLSCSATLWMALCPAHNNNFMCVPGSLGNQGANNHVFRTPALSKWNVGSGEPQGFAALFPLCGDHVGSTF